MHYFVKETTDNQHTFAQFAVPDRQLMINFVMSLCDMFTAVYEWHQIGIFE